MNKSFTLVETIIAIAVSSLVFVAVLGFIYYFYRTNNYNLSQITAINNARKGMEVMIRETREATYSEEGSYPVKEAQLQSFIFYSDIDRDDDIERVQYFLEDDFLKRGILEATGNPPQYQEENEEIRILSQNVRNGEESIFTYYDADNNEVMDLEILTDIKLVKIRLIINVDPNRPPGEFTLVSNAQLRNLKQE